MLGVSTWECLGRRLYNWAHLIPPLLISSPTHRPRGSKARDRCAPGSWPCPAGHLGLPDPLPHGISCVRNLFPPSPTICPPPAAFPVLPSAWSLQPLRCSLSRLWSGVCSLSSAPCPRLGLPFRDSTTGECAGETSRACQQLGEKSKPEEHERGGKNRAQRAAKREGKTPGQGKDAERDETESSCGQRGGRVPLR